MRFFRTLLRTRAVAALSVAVNIFLLLAFIDYSKKKVDLECSKKHPSESIGVMMMEFEMFNSAMSESIEYFQDFDSIVIISDVNIYPPLKQRNSLAMNKLKTVVFNEVFMNRSLYNTRSEKFLNSEYILIVPDGVVLDPTVKAPGLVEEFASLKKQRRDLKLVAFPVEKTDCHNVKFRVREWTLQFLSADEKTCNFVTGTHVIMMKTAHFLHLEKPFLRPVFQSVYIQLATSQFKIAISYQRPFKKINFPHIDLHSKKKHEANERSREKFLYQQLGIKLVRHTDGQEQWFGCGRNTQRCFGTVHNAMPDYLFIQRWTPPCCLNNLRQTARYVFTHFHTRGVRYWLEGGSLLGAVRSGDIIPWDYDVDIGIYKNDMEKSHQLTQAMKGPYEDEQGFVWVKATEGDFYRVHFSASNHLHVDIFPFYSKNGIMTKDFWFEDHVQDTEFPEHFLQPLVDMEFAGFIASAPNNAKQFLELKFGQGVVENPKYPDAENVKV